MCKEWHYVYLYSFTSPRSAIEDYDFKYLLHWPFTFQFLGIDAAIEKIQYLQKQKVF